MKANTNIQFKNYSLYRCPGNETDGVFHGGIVILANNNFTQKHISLNTNLQAVAVRVSWEKEMTGDLLG